MKHKTLTVWLSLLAGPFGLHRIYLFGIKDRWAWIFPMPTLLGAYGIYRVQLWGLDDHASWVLIPFLGFTLAACALQAIVYGLTPAEQWTTKFGTLQGTSKKKSPIAFAQTNWLTIIGIAASLLIGTTVLMSSIAFSFQRYFEYQIEEAKSISQ